MFQPDSQLSSSSSFIVYIVYVQYAFLAHFHNMTKLPTVQRDYFWLLPFSSPPAICNNSSAEMLAPITNMASAEIVALFSGAKYILLWFLKHLIWEYNQNIPRFKSYLDKLFLAVTERCRLFQ